MRRIACCYFVRYLVVFIIYSFLSELKRRDILTNEKNTDRRGATITGACTARGSARRATGDAFSYLRRKQPSDGKHRCRHCPQIPQTLPPRNRCLHLDARQTRTAFHIFPIVWRCWWQESARAGTRREGPPAAREPVLCCRWPRWRALKWMNRAVGVASVGSTWTNLMLLSDQWSRCVCLPRHAPVQMHTIQAWGTSVTAVRCPGEVNTFIDPCMLCSSYACLSQLPYVTDWWYNTIYMVNGHENKTVFNVTCYITM